MSKGVKLSQARSTHTHTHTHTRTHTRMHTDTHAPTHTHPDTHTHTYTHPHAHAHTRAHTPTHLPTHTPTRTRTHTHTHTHILTLLSCPSAPPFSQARMPRAVAPERECMLSLPTPHTSVDCHTVAHDIRPQIIVVASVQAVRVRAAIAHPKNALKKICQRKSCTSHS